MEAGNHRERMAVPSGDKCIETAAHGLSDVQNRIGPLHVGMKQHSSIGCCFFYIL